LNHFERLNKKYRQQGVQYKYHWKGPWAQCWCEKRLRADSEICDTCQTNMVAYLSLKKIPKEILLELSKGPFSNWGLPKEEEQEKDLAPQTYDQAVLQRVVKDQDIQLCFYCGRQDHLVQEQRTEALPFLHMIEIEPPEPEKKFNVGEMTPPQESDFTRLLWAYKDIFAWDISELEKTNQVYHTIDVGEAKPV
jgi:hypothetical protein